MKKLRLTISILLFFAITQNVSLFAQVFINNGSFVNAEAGSFIQINGSLLNDNGDLSIYESGGNNAEITITGNFTNNSLTNGAGHIILYGNWNNNSTFNSFNGTVFLNGNNQLLSGSVSTNFHNLTLDGTGIKTQTINKYVNGTLDLKHLELQTNENHMFVENTNSNAIIRTSGFVSSTEQGSLSRKTLSQNKYLFPVGSSQGITRYRPVEIEPQNSTLNQYHIRLANVDATVEGFDRSIKEEDICNTNSLFYHRIYQSLGNALVNMDVYFNESLDGTYDGIANWNTESIWSIVPTSSIAPGIPLAKASVNNWQLADATSSYPYILFNENFSIYAGDDIIVCSDNPVINLAASFNGVGGVVWSGGNGVFSPNNSSLNATYTPTASEIAAGSLTLTISANVAAGACEAVSDQLEITFLPSPDINVIVTSNYNGENISCFGASDGIASVIPPDFVSYSWDAGTGNQTGAQASNLAAGNYTVTVVDSNGCIAVSSVQLNQPSQININLVPTDVSCFGLNDGRIISSVTGGTPVYTYLWNDPGNTSGPNLLNASSGNYNLLVTDFNGCTAISESQINQPDQLVISISSMPVICGTSLGSALANASGGNGGYQFLWSHGDAGSQANNLSSGFYEVTVTDARNCSSTGNVFIGVQGDLNLSIIQTSPVSCFGESDASLLVNVAGGANPFEYLWSNNATTQTISNLTAGLYSVQVTDNWGCMGSSSYTVVQPQQIIVNINSTNVLCFGGNDGLATAVPDGGSGPYTYIWSNSQFSQTIASLTVGTYFVTVTDNNNCSSTGQTTITQPETPISVVAEVSNIRCYGENNGYVITQASGGTAPYLYTFEYNDQLVNVSEIYNLPQGFYNLTVSDANSCLFTEQYIISEPSEIVAGYQSAGPSCINNNDGFIEFNVIGGTAPYSFSWTGGYSPVEYIEGLISGTYWITITDENECSISIGPVILVDNEVDCLNIPNAFTPNGDGINDEWIIEGIHIFPKAIVKVFNRWGQILYDAPASTGNWDGFYNGKQLPTGSYLYVIHLHDGSPDHVGIVTIMH